LDKGDTSSLKMNENVSPTETCSDGFYIRSLVCPTAYSSLFFFFFFRLVSSSFVCVRGLGRVVVAFRRFFFVFFFVDKIPFAVCFCLLLLFFFFCCLIVLSRCDVILVVIFSVFLWLACASFAFYGVLCSLGVMSLTLFFSFFFVFFWVFSFFFFSSSSPMSLHMFRVKYHPFLNVLCTPQLIASSF